MKRGTMRYNCQQRMVYVGIMVQRPATRLMANRGKGRDARDVNYVVWKGVERKFPLYKACAMWCCERMELPMANECSLPASIFSSSTIIPRLSLQYLSLLLQSCSAFLLPILWHPKAIWLFSNVSVSPADIHQQILIPNSCNYVPAQAPCRAWPLQACPLLKPSKDLRYP